MFVYHGSAYDQKKLQPGFNHTKQLVQWDDVESNQYLYGTTDKTQATVLGFAALLDKNYGLTEFHHRGKKITVVLDDKSVKSLLKKDLIVYLYSCNKDNLWIKNNNPKNNLSTEYKTQETITPARKTRINITDWLSEHGYSLTVLRNNKLGSQSW